ncbi:MAG: pilin [bacterium]
MNKFNKYVISLAFTALIALPSFMALPVHALSEDGTALLGGEENSAALKTGAFGGDKNPQQIAAGVINVLMGFLGLVAVVIILFGGFKWMTAAGAEDKIEEAKKLLVAGVVGLVIILSAWAIATFVIDQILTSTKGTA